MTPPPSTLETALAAYDAGINVVRTKTDGSKFPVAVAGWGRLKDGERGYGWDRFKSERPDRTTVEQWFADGHPGLSYICGAVSGNLEMIELEGRAVDEGVTRKIFAKAQERGLEDLLTRISAGYTERSPSNGLHWLIRCVDPVEPNQKLARRPATPEELEADPETPSYVLIETRGEGGQTVAAPSSGPTHPTGKAWEMVFGDVTTITTVTAEERSQLLDLLREFDEVGHDAPQPPPPSASKTKPSPWNGGPIGESWVNAVVDHLDATVGAAGALYRHGWTPGERDGLVQRPGKDHTSGLINANGRFVNFSTNAPFASGPADGSQHTTYDTLDIIAVYEHGGDRTAAARRIAEDTGILDAWKAEQTARNDETREQLHTVGNAPNIDPTTGEIAPSRNLPDEFWNARPILAHIRQAAHSRARSADAVLLATLARVCALIPPSIVLPPIIGSKASLNMLGAPIGTSGAGKTTGNDVAAELVPIIRKDIVADVPMGSGEGLVELFFEFVMEENLEGKKERVKRQTKTGMVMYLDEGQALAEMGGRKGSTLLPTLRSAWSGATIGQSNASQETHRVLKPHSYRMAVVVGFQLEYAVGLINDAAGGTPQRFVFAAANDPSIPDEAPPWPGPIDVDAPSYATSTFTEITVAKSIQDLIRKNGIMKSRGQIVVPPLDAHRDLVRLKVGALLGHLDGRWSVNDEDWELAGDVMTASDAVRSWIVTAAKQAAAAEEMAAHRRAAKRELVVGETLTTKALEQAAKSIANKVHRVGEPLRANELARAVAGKTRKQIDVADAIDLAEQRDWIIRRDDATWVAGKAKPA